MLLGKVEDYGPPCMEISWGIYILVREARRKFMGNFHGGFGFEKIALSKFHAGFSWGVWRPQGGNFENWGI